MRLAVEARQFVPVPVSVGAPSLDEIIASTSTGRHDFEPYGIGANRALVPEPPRPSGANGREDGDAEDQPLNL